RDEFLGVASHELRTPLTVVMGYAETLVRRARRGTLQIEDATATFDDLLLYARRLASLIDDLLDTSRIQQGRLLLEPGRVDLGQPAAAVVERFRQNTTLSAGHDLALIQPAQAIVGIWDESRLDQVLTNLVSNALKYSPDGGAVTVTVEQDADRAFARVAD